MPEITRRRQGEMVRGLFNLLRGHPEGLPAREVIARLQQVAPPTPFEESEYPDRPGQRRYEKIVRWATVDPVKAGWMVKSQGNWTVTPEGLAAAERMPDDDAFFKEAVRLYRQWRSANVLVQEASDEAETTEAQPPSEVTLEEAAETARNEIREYLAGMPPYDFQELVASLLRAMGYHVPWVAPPGPDRGVDVVAFTDPLGANGPRIKVQVKRRRDVIRVPEVRAFMAVLGANDVGVFVTTSRFTPDALEEVRGQEVRRIQLLDGDIFIDLWIEHYNAVPEAAKQLLPLKPIYYLAT